MSKKVAEQQLLIPNLDGGNGITLRVDPLGQTFDMLKDPYRVHVMLPDGWALCRLVDAPEVRTAQEFVAEVDRRSGSEGSMPMAMENWYDAAMKVVEEWGLE